MGVMQNENYINYNKYNMFVWRVRCRLPTHQMYGVNLLNLCLFNYVLGQNWREVWCVYDLRILTGIAVWMSVLWLVDRVIFAASTWVPEQFSGSSQMNDCTLLTCVFQYCNSTVDIHCFELVWPGVAVSGTRFSEWNGEHPA